MPNLSPIRVAIIGVDKFTAPLHLFNSHVRQMTKPLSDLNSHMARFGKAAGFERIGSALSRVKDSIGGVVSSVSGLAMKLGMIGVDIDPLVNRLLELFAGLCFLSSGLRCRRLLEQLQYAAGMADIDMESFNKNMKIFSVNIAEASAGSGAALPAFKALGIQVKDIATGKSRSAKDIILDLAGAMNKLGDPNMRNRVAKTIFGKSGVDMVKMFKGGREELEKTMARAAEFGVFTEEGAGKSEKFADTLKQTKFAFMGIRNVIGVELMPIFTEWMKKLQDLVVVYRPQIQAFAKRFAEGLPARIGKLIEAAKKLWEDLNPILEFFKGVVEYLGPTKTAFGILATAFTITVVPAVYSLATAIGALTIAFLASPIGLATIAVGALGLAIYGLESRYANLKKALQGPVSVSTVKEAKTKALGNLQNLYVKSLTEKGRIEDSPELQAAEKKVKSFGVDLPENNVEQRVKMVNDMYNENVSIPSGANLLPPSTNQVRTNNNNTSQTSKVELSVDFSNIPRGAKVSKKTSGAPADLDLNLGYASMMTQ